MFLLYIKGSTLIYIKITLTKESSFYIIPKCKAKILDRVGLAMDNNKGGQNSLDAVEDVYEMAVLMDFYGQLLTKRQYEVMDLHYNSDLSLGEIAEDIGISRQGVHDSIRKAKQTLIGYERRLGLAERFKVQEKNVEKALTSLRQMGEKIPQLAENTEYKTAVKLLEKLMDTL